MLGNEFVEDREVAGLLIVHVFHQRPEVRVRADDRGCLSRVDSSGCEFAGLVDSEGTVEKLALGFTQAVFGFRVV